MAETDKAVEVHGTATVTGTVAKRPPELIVGEIEQTRENLARTIDALAEKVSPANNIRRVRERVTEQAARPDVRLAAAAIGLAVLGVVVWKAFGRRRK
jgi:hypothetical protein